MCVKWEEDIDNDDDDDIDSSLDNNNNNNSLEINNYTANAATGRNFNLSLDQNSEQTDSIVRKSLLNIR